MKSLVILISGRGSNLRAIVEANIPLEIKAVISNQPTAAGLDFARSRAIATHVVDHTRYSSRDEFDAAIEARIAEQQPDFIALAGFMRVLTPGFVNRHLGRLINIHPSLLPAFPGLHTHRQALATGVKIHGCSVHFVTPQLDDGPIIIQAAVPVIPQDTEQTLAARVLRHEHEIYPLALRWLGEGKVRLAADGSVNSKVDCVAETSLISPKERA
jgi:phosphoribosylglycinamide formyltransferase 1